MSTARNVAKITSYIKLRTTGFDRLLKNIKIVEAGNGNCVAEYTVDKDVANVIGGMHGGFAATLVDAVSCYALHSDDDLKTFIPRISVDLHVTFIQAVKIGEEIVIDAKTLRSGAKLAYMNVEIRKKLTGEVVVQGLHTLYLNSIQKLQETSSLPA